MVSEKSGNAIMDKYNIAHELRAISMLMTAKKAKTVYDVETKAVKTEVKGILKDKMNILMGQINKKLSADMKGKGFTVVHPVESSLGNFKGHPYISNTKLYLQRKGADWNKVLTGLNEVYSHKFKLKNVSEDGVAYFAFR